MKYAILLLTLVVLAGIFGPQSFFVVDETQSAIVTRFGDPVRPSLQTPGIYAKAPFIDTVTYFDKRNTLFDAPPQDFLTEDKRRLVIDAYAIAKIDDPLQFFKTVRNPQGAVTRGTDIINSELRKEIANDLQAEIIRTKRDSIMNEVLNSVRPELSGFGVYTQDVRIKRADFPDEVAESIYERMRAERKEQANVERAEGARQDLEIRATVDKDAAIIKAAAERDANIIRGAGEAEAIRILADALEEDSEFYTFQRSLEAYKASFTGNTTFVLPATSDLFQFLQSPTGLGDKQTNDRSDSELLTLETAAKVALLTELGMKDSQSVEKPTLTKFERTQWQDSSLGCPQAGETYEEGDVPGYIFVFQLEEASYKLHSNHDASLHVLCRS